MASSNSNRSGSSRREQRQAKPASSAASRSRSATKSRTKQDKPLKPAQAANCKRASIDGAAISIPAVGKPRWTAGAPVTFTPRERWIDADQTQRLGAELNELVRQKVDVILDFRYVDFVDSSGIGAIVALNSALRSHDCMLSISNVKGQPLRLLQMLCLSALVDIGPRNKPSKAR